MKNLSAVIHRETLSTGEAVFVAHCPELDVTSQGKTREAARTNLEESVAGLLEVASEAEIARRLQQGATVEHLKIAA